MKPLEFFNSPGSVAQKQYEALRMYYLEGKSAKEVAMAFGYKPRGFTTILSEFKKKLRESNDGEGLFFKTTKRGRKPSASTSQAKELIIQLRKSYHSVEEIKSILDSKKHNISERNIYNVLIEEGFSRLPRRTKLMKHELNTPKIQAEKSCQLNFSPDKFKSTSAGILALLPYIKKYGIHQAIAQSNYPGTKSIGALNSILSFVALKASNIRRYSSDDKWCMDRGLGLFAGLNVLPKASWYTSYSHRVTPKMNLKFLRSLHKIWLENGLLSDTSNLDFTTIPYWGENDHLENNWSGKRGKAMASMLAILAHDPDTGIINYGHAGVMHKGESAQVLEFLDFYNSGATTQNNNLQYLIFDSKFTNYQNLKILDKEGVKFITIRRRGKAIVERLERVEAKSKKKIRVQMAGNKKRGLSVLDEEIFLKGYDGNIRQISISGHGKIKPAIIITNDFELKVEDVVRKYARRWLVEKAISEQIDFFHLNLVSSSMVIKVDFDLAMSILTHNIFRLFAMELERYSHNTDQSIYDKFIQNSADIDIRDNKIMVSLKKKRNLPLVLENLQKFKAYKYDWLGNFQLDFIGASYS